MKTNDKKALHDLQLSELVSKLSELEKQYHLARMQNAARKLTNTSLLHTLRKDIAVLRTIISDKELALRVQ